MSTPYKGKGRNKPFTGAPRKPGYPKKVYRAKKGTAIRYRYPKSNWNTMTTMAYPMPQKMNTQLVINTNQGLISALTSSQAIVYRPTSYFDFDPAVGGGSYAGYTFFSSMYGRYRVLAFQFKITFTNLESTSALVGVQAIASSATPGSGTAVDYTEMAIENDYGWDCLLSPTTSTPTHTLSGYVNTTRLWGTPETKTDNDWAGGAGTSPAVNSWLRISAHMINNANMTTGVQFQLRVKAYGYWDQKNPDVTG